MNLKEQTEKINDNMIFVEKGEYKPSFSREKKEVCNLFVNKYQVTQDEWKKHMETDPSNFKGEKRPIENITWIDSLKFCNKLSENYGFQPVYKIENGRLIRIIYTTGEEVLPFEADFSKTEGYRLPTEVEWEWFSKGGREAIENENFNLKYSGSENIEEVAWYFENSNGQTHTVGIKKSNELGLYDCTGNVWEWCYDTTTDDILKGKSYSFEKNNFCKRIRGSSWCDTEAYCLINYRASSSSYSYNIGFRICRTAKK